MGWLAYLKEFTIWSMLVRLVLAMLIGFLIGYEREKLGRPAGLRTHILVCVGACMTSLIGIFIWTQDPQSDPLRVTARVLLHKSFPVSVFWVSEQSWYADVTILRD